MSLLHLIAEDLDFLRDIMGTRAIASDRGIPTAFWDASCPVASEGIVPLVHAPVHFAVPLDLICVIPQGPLGGWLVIQKWIKDISIDL